MLFAREMDSSNRVDEKNAATAFHEMYVTWKPYIRGIFWRLAVVTQGATIEEDIEDLTDEVFLRVIRHKDWQEVENPKAWLSGIAKHVWQEFRRKEMLYRKEVRLEEVSARARQLLATSPENDANEQLKRDLKTALQKLSPEHKQVILSFFYEGKSYQEIAATEGIAVSTVRARVHRALNFLRRAANLRTEIDSYSEVDAIPQILAGKPVYYSKERKQPAPTR